MNQPDSRPVGVPGGGRRFDAPSQDRPTHDAPSHYLGRPGAANSLPGSNLQVPKTDLQGLKTDLQGLKTDRLLADVEADLDSVDEKATQEQVPVFDRIHTALADALARTADTGGSPAGGHQGA